MAATRGAVVYLEDDGSYSQQVRTVGNPAVAGDVAHDAADSGSPVKVGGVYNASAPSLDDGDRGDVQLDVNGNAKVVVGAEEVWSFADAFGTDADISVKASAGYLMSVVVTNTNAAVRYLQVHNKATAPANPDVPIMSIKIPIGSGSTVPVFKIGTEHFGPGGRHCATGIAIGISTTEATFTAATASDHDVSIAYV